MGGRSSKEDRWRHNLPVRSSSSASTWSAYLDPHSGYAQGSHTYEPQSCCSSHQFYVPRPQNFGYDSYEPSSSGRVTHDDRTKWDRRYSRSDDNYNSLDEVTEALARAGLGSSNLIVGFDFTKSNEWTGKNSFNRGSLHHIGSGLNPYEQAISLIGKNFAAFKEDNLIPCSGFGDGIFLKVCTIYTPQNWYFSSRKIVIGITMMPSMAASTHDQEVFSFYPDESFCSGFENLLSQHREIVPHLQLAGPTSFHQ